jgi:hypothetical protein
MNTERFSLSLENRPEANHQELEEVIIHGE